MKDIKCGEVGAGRGDMASSRAGVHARQGAPGGGGGGVSLTDLSLLPMSWVSMIHAYPPKHRKKTERKTDKKDSGGRGGGVGYLLLGL